MRDGKPSETTNQIILLTETGNITETRNGNRADQSRAECIKITAREKASEAKETQIMKNETDAEKATRER